MIVLVTSLVLLALISSVILLAALRMGSSDPGFQAGSADMEPVRDDDENHAA